MCKSIWVKVVPAAPWRSEVEKDIRTQSYTRRRGIDGSFAIRKQMLTIEKCNFDLRRIVENVSKSIWKLLTLSGILYYALFPLAACCSTLGSTSTARAADAALRALRAPERQSI